MIEIGCKVYYFSGAYSQPLKRKLNIDQLFSVHLERKLIKDTIQYKHEHPEYTAKIMVDSGAFSFFQNMKKKGIVMTAADKKAYTDEYIEFLNAYGKDLECFVAVDSVPDPTDVNPNYAQETWDNYLYMYSKLNEDIRNKLIPVFHYGEDFKWLKNFLEYTHEDGSHIAYIGLAISLEGTKKVRITWGQECMNIIAHSSNPNVKTHAFGVGVKSVLDHIEVTSTDATSWVKRAAYGMIAIEDRSVVLSDVQKAQLKGKHFTEKSQAYQEDVIKKVEERGFTIQELEEDCYKRAEFNILDTLEWMKEYTEKDKVKPYSKVDLGW